MSTAMSLNIAMSDAADLMAEGHVGGDNNEAGNGAPVVRVLLEDLHPRRQRLGRIWEGHGGRPDEERTCEFGLSFGERQARW
jgi:hypothetical protein